MYFDYIGLCSQEQCCYNGIIRVGYIWYRSLLQIFLYTLPCKNNVFPQKGISPLYSASAIGHTEIVDILLKHGADPNLPTTVRGLVCVCVCVYHAHVHHMMMCCHMYIPFFYNYTLFYAGPISCFSPGSSCSGWTYTNSWETIERKYQYQSTEWGEEHKLPSLKFFHNSCLSLFVLSLLCCLVGWYLE